MYVAARVPLSKQGGFPSGVATTTHPGIHGTRAASAFGLTRVRVNTPSFGSSSQRETEECCREIKSDRVVVPSLIPARAINTRTVDWASPSSYAISLLVRPSAASATTCCSRLESRAGPEGLGAFSRART